MTNFECMNHEQIVEYAQNASIKIVVLEDTNFELNAQVIQLQKDVENIRIDRDKYYDRYDKESDKRRDLERKNEAISGALRILSDGMKYS